MELILEDSKWEDPEIIRGDMVRSSLYGFKNSLKTANLFHLCFTQKKKPSKKTPESFVIIGGRCKIISSAALQPQS